MGRIPLDTPHGRRPMLRFTFRYMTPENGSDVWYACETDHFDWRDRTWSAAPVEFIQAAA